MSMGEIVFALALSGLLMLAVWIGVADNNKRVECRDACAPVQYKMIDSVCHCSTGTGWERVR